jgi:hypothetical protein
VYFKFFLFLRTGSQNLNGSGDAVIIRDNIMKLRVYNNVTDSLLFKFTTGIDGRNSIILPDTKIIYTKHDSTFPIIMTHYLYMILTAENFDMKQDSHIKEILNGENGIKKIIFTYFQQNIKIVIEKRFIGGRPERINCIINDDSLLFDITTYDNYDFFVDSAGYRELIDDSNNSLFKWLGDFYEER